MQVQVDTREHVKEWERIKGQFDALGVKYFRSKLYVGDYQSLDNPRLVIDRKKDLQEICGNVCQQHERFKAELLRAKEQGIKLVILCEHGADIKSLEDVYFWSNPRKYQIRWKTVNGKRVKDVISAKAVDGFQSTRPSRGETRKTCFPIAYSEFQSTRPSRGETISTSL